MTKKISVALSVLLAVAVISGCSDRGTNVPGSDFEPRKANEAMITNVGGHQAPYELGLSMFIGVRTFPAIPYKMYTPYFDVAPTQGIGAKYPVLYLLAPLDGPDAFYFDRGLAAIADSLIYYGEIDPMIIVCLAADDGYGGTFYANSWSGGKYSDAYGKRGGGLIDGSIIDYLEAIYNIDTNRVNRGISGFGMGGYGAFRIGVEHFENFGSISAVSAPLDFDGPNGNGGFVPLFQQVIDQIDPSGVISQEEYKNIDTTSEFPLRTLFFAAACSFSPHILDYETVTGTPPVVGGDTTFLEDTLTYFNTEGTIEFHLPFDSTGDVRQQVWDYWLDNDILRIMDNYPGALTYTNMKFFNVSDHEFGFTEQTNSFADSLGVLLNRRLTPMTFPGYEGYPAVSSSRYVYDILPEILKFHSETFDVPQ